MKNRILFLLASLSLTSAVLGSQPTPQNRYSPDARSKALENQKRQMRLDAQERMEVRAKGRQIQAKGGAIVDITTEIKNIIRNAPLSIQQQNPTTVVAILNQVVQGAGIAIRAYGRRKEALQAIVDTNEQIIEAAARSYEKIVALTDGLDKLIGRATIQSSLKLIQASEDMTKGQKILLMMNPTNFLNTFVNFTDSLYITDNKAIRWEKIKEASKALKEEQARFDDYIALLEIKVLENMMMEYHRIENFNTVKNPAQDQESTVGYIGVLETSSDTLDHAIVDIDNKILAVQNQEPKGGLLNHLKKVVGKDFESQKNKDLQALMTEKEKYLKQKLDVDQKIAHYQSLKLTPEQIAAGRADLLADINAVQVRRARKMNADELTDTVMELKGQVLKLQNEITAIRNQPSAVAFEDSRLSQKAQTAPIQPTKIQKQADKPTTAPENPAYQPASHFYPSTYPRLSTR